VHEHVEHFQVPAVGISGAFNPAAAQLNPPAGAGVAGDRFEEDLEPKEEFDSIECSVWVDGKEKSYEGNFEMGRSLVSLATSSSLGTTLGTT